MYFHIIEDKEAIHITRLTLTITQTHRNVSTYIGDITYTYNYHNHNIKHAICTATAVITVLILS